MKKLLLMPLLILFLSHCKTSGGSGSQAKGEPLGAPMGPAETSMVQGYIGHLDKDTNTDFRMWEDPSNAGKVLAAVQKSKDGPYINLFPIGSKSINGTHIMTNDESGDYRKADLIVFAGYKEGQFTSAWATTLTLQPFTGKFTATVNSDVSTKDTAQYSFTFDVFGGVLKDEFEELGAIFSSVPKDISKDSAFAPDQNLWLGFEKHRCSCPAGFQYRESGDEGGELNIYVDGIGTKALKPFAIHYFAGSAMTKEGPDLLEKYEEKPANLSPEEQALTITDLSFKAVK
jgi:hypothetical protein